MARLHDVLSAARAPGRPDELAREDAALAAFRSAAGSTPRAHGRRAGRLLAIKVGALAGALAVGATAVAATTGVIPLSPSRANERSGVVPAPAGVSPRTGKSVGRPSPNATRLEPLGLCRAYLAHLEGQPEAKPEKSWDPEAFRVLSAVAGGDDRVHAYCTELVVADDKDRGRSSTAAVKP